MATITKLAGVPRPKIRLRHIIPTSNVIGQITSPVRTANGHRHAAHDQPGRADTDQERRRRLEHAGDRRTFVVAAPADDDEHHHRQDVEAERRRRRVAGGDVTGQPSDVNPPSVPLKNSSGCGPSPSWSGSASSATTRPSTK